MKFDRKARALLLWVLLPLYLVMLGFFIYVSNVYRGKYELPRQRISQEFLDFAEKGYRLAQAAHVGARRIEPGTVIDRETAEGLVRVYGVLGRSVAVVPPGGEFSPQSAPAVEASRLAGEGRFLVHDVSIGPPAEGVNLDAGSPLTAEAAARIEEAARADGFEGEVTVAAAERVAVPEEVESPEFTAFLEAEYILDEPVTIEIDGDKVIKQRGTVVDREILLGLMRMRDARLRGEFVKVRGKGPVIGFQYTFVFIVLNFLILVVFLYGLLWKPIITVLDKRRERISTDLATAREQRGKAEKLFEKYRGVMESSRAQREKIIADGRNEGQRERERIVEEARAEANALLERARLLIKAERERVRRELTAEVGGFAVALAEKILAREISQKDHEELINEFLCEIGAGERADGDG